MPTVQQRPARKIRETGGPTSLLVGVIADLDVVRRNGGNLEGISVSDLATELAPYLAPTVDLSWKHHVRCATTGNVNLANGLENGDTIDGVTLATSDRVLVKSQSTAAENGIYVVPSSGAASRADDANTAAELESAAVWVDEGTVNADTAWVQTADNFTLGSGSVVWAQFDGKQLSFTNGLTRSGNTIQPDYGTAANKVCQGNDSRLSDARTPTSHASSHAPGGSDALAQIFCTVDRSSDATNAMTGGAWTAIPFNRDLTDASNLHDPSSNNTRFTIPAGYGGFYRVTVQIAFTGSISPVVFGYRINGGSIVQLSNEVTTGAGPAIGFGFGVELAAGEYLECMIFNTGSTDTYLATYTRAQVSRP